MIQLITLVGELATTWMQGKAEEAKVKQEVKIWILVYIRSL